jgi:hypothetical protein
LNVSCGAPTNVATESEVATSDNATANVGIRRSARKYPSASVFRRAASVPIVAINTM